MNNLAKQLIESKSLIVIGGATASGKTDLSLELSEYLPIEIISADSRQVYKYLSIGTAKPSNEELLKIKHHKIDFLNPDQYYSAGQFAKEAEILVNELFDEGKIPVVVGGSGLYIKALYDGIFDDGLSNDYSAIRMQLENSLIENGIDALYTELKQVDPVSALLYLEKNPRRIIRALEYFHTNNISLSEAQIKFQYKPDFNTIYFAIDWNRDLLYQRINKRTHCMWQSGLLEETQQVLEMGYKATLNSLNTVGYKETIDYINGRITEDRAIELIQQHTRNYAKRQITWFKKVPSINWINNSSKNIISILNHKLSHNNLIIF